MRLRTVLIGLAVLMVAILAGAAALVMSVDFNQYKGLIADQVKQATGRDLTIVGDFKLALSLRPSVAVENVGFANVPGGSRPQMVVLKRLEVQMQLLPLLSRRIEVDRLVLDGADILLETDKKGRGNWVLSNGAIGAAAASPAPEGESAVPLPQIGVVQIRNSLVTYRDGQTNTSRSFRIEKLNAETKDGRVALDLAALIGKAAVTAKGSIGAPEMLAGAAPYPFDLTITSANSSAILKGTVRDVAEMRGIAMDLSAKGKALSDWNGVTDAALPPLGPYSLTAKASDIPGGYGLSGLKLTMGGSSLGGDLTLQLAKRPKLTAALSADRIDLKDFGVTPAASGGVQPSSGAVSGDGRVFPATPLPLAGLGLADADVKLAAKEVIRAPVTLSNVKLVLSLAAGKLQIRPFSSGIGGGTVIANLSLDSARTPAPVALDLTESNVEAGKLLQVLAGTTVLSGGRTNLKADVTGAGNSVRAIMAGLNGKLDYAMGSGSINNDFARLLLADLFRLFSFGSGGDSSNLRCVVAHFDINRGLATTRQLAIETSGATILGNGTVNLATEGLDIHLVPHATAANLANLAVPVIVGGTMAHPHVVPDAAAIATGAVGGVVTMPLTALSTIGSIAGFGGSGGAPGAGCGAAEAASQPGPAARQPTSPAGQILQGVGNGAKGAADTLKSLLP